MHRGKGIRPLAGLGALCGRLSVLVDQDYQVLRMEAFGVAIRLEITTITREELKGAILELINKKTVSILL